MKIQLLQCHHNNYKSEWVFNDLFLTYVLILKENVGYLGKLFNDKTSQKDLDKLLHLYSSMQKLKTMSQATCPSEEWEKMNLNKIFGRKKPQRSHVLPT